VTDVFSRPWRFPAFYHEDEDINSLVVRMAANGCMTSAEFVRHYLKADIGMFNEGSYQLSALRLLAIMACVDEGSILRNAVVSLKWSQTGRPAFAAQFRGGLMSGGGSFMKKRVAPSMLKADGAQPYVRVAWRFHTLVADPTTGEVLQSHCPNCLRNLLWRSSKLCICHHCRFDIREAAPVFLAERELVAIRKLARALGLLGTAPTQPLKLPPPFEDLTLDQQLGALAWLAGLRGRMEGTLLTASVSNIYLGLELAENWERTVRQLVALVFRQTAGEPKDIVRDLLRHFDSIPNQQLKATIIAAVAQQAAIVAPDHTFVPTWHRSRVPQYMAGFPRYALSAIEPPEKRSAKSVKRPRPAESSR